MAQNGTKVKLTICFKHFLTQSLLASPAPTTSVAQRLPSTASIPRQRESLPASSASSPSSASSQSASPPPISIPPVSSADGAETSQSHSVPPQRSSTPAASICFTTRSGEQYAEGIFSLSTDPTERAHQTSHLEVLESKFTAAKLRRHTFTWDSHRREWVPVYAFYVRPSGACSIEDVWHEHVFGMDGQLSIQQISVTNRLYSASSITSPLPTSPHSPISTFTSAWA